MAKRKLSKKKPRVQKGGGGLKLFEAGKAEENLRRSLAANADDHRAAYELGFLLAGLGREREAIPFLRQAVQHAGEPQRALASEMLAKCTQKEAADALAHSREIFRSVIRELQQSQRAAAPPPPTLRLQLSAPEAAVARARVECKHWIEGEESVLEIARADDGIVRLDFIVVSDGVEANSFAASSEQHLTFHVDSPGAERSRPAFQHSIRLEGCGEQTPVYLPLRRGVNHIRMVGDCIQSVDAWTPDSSPARPPNQLIIPITSYCNFQCVMCPHGLPEGVKDKAHYPDALAELLIAELNGYSQSCDVALTGLGESFMAPGFVQFVEAVKNPLVKFNFTTNGSMLTPERNAWILASKIWRVNVSLDAGTPETFFKIRRADWGRVIRNLEALAEAAAASGRKDFQLELNMTLMRENIDEIEQFLWLAYRLRASAYLAYLNDYDCNGGWVVEHDGYVFDYQKQILRSGPEVTEKISRALALAHELRVPFNMETDLRPLLDLGPTGERVETDPEALATETPPISHCPAPWATDMEAAAVVHADGSIGMCCLQSPIGNIQAAGSLMAVWQGTTARKVREDMLAGVIPQQCAAANCSFVAAQRAWSKGERSSPKPVEIAG